MTRFRTQIVGLTLVLATLAVMGHVSVGQGNGGSEAALLLAAVGIAVALMLWQPLLSRIAPAVMVVLTVAGYMLIRTTPFVTEREWAGWAPTVALAELTLCIGAVLLARQIALHLIEFEDAVANITFGDLARVKSMSSSEEDIALEMSRARRHERPLTVTVLSAEAVSVPLLLHRIIQDVQHTMMQRYIMSGLARLAAQATRRGDIVVQDAARNRVIVLSPEASPEQIEHLAERLQHVAAERLGLPIRYGSAGFPQHALTFDDLVNHASMLAGDMSVSGVLPTNELAMRRHRQAWAAAGDARLVLPVDDGGGSDVAGMEAIRGD